MAFGDLNQRYKRERDEELHENKDWWPVLLRIGYEAVGDVSDVDLDKVDQARDGTITLRESDQD